MICKSNVSICNLNLGNGAQRVRFKTHRQGIDKQGKRQGLLKSETALDAAIIYIQTFSALLRQCSVPRRQPMVDRFPDAYSKRTSPMTTL